MTAPSEDVVEQIVAVLRSVAGREGGATYGEMARAVLASTPLRQYFRDLVHADEGKPASDGESHRNG